MTQRKYSVAEIDRMRWAIRRTFPMEWSGSMGQPLKLTAEHDAAVEDRLRTFMLNGTDPEELEKAVNDGETLDPDKSNG